MATLKFKIATPEKVVYEKDSVAQVTIPTMNGEITILPNHIPLVSVVKAGELRVRDREGEHLMAVAGGFLEVRGNNEIVILADNAERAQDIDIAKAEAAHLLLFNRIYFNFEVGLAVAVFFKVAGLLFIFNNVNSFISSDFI